MCHGQRQATLVNDQNHSQNVILTPIRALLTETNTAAPAMILLIFTTIRAPPRIIGKLTSIPRTGNLATLVSQKPTITVPRHHPTAKLARHSQPIADENRRTFHHLTLPN
jgi:hypothetical protein